MNRRILTGIPFVIASVILWGSLVAVITSVPALYNDGARLMPAAAAVGFTLALAAAWLLAGRLPARGGVAMSAKDG